jgi:two-component system phosphate regulon response regulator PhoB
MNKTLKPSMLIVEDDEAVVAVLKYNLQKEGYQINVSHDGRDAFDQAKLLRPDLILLDWVLPSISGIELCRMLREDEVTANIPIIILSNKDSDFDKITGLDKGADDYITKPCSPSELSARIRAILRRMRPAFSGKMLRYEDITMDLDAHKVTRNGAEIKLAPIEYQILQILMEAPSRVFSREALIDKIWGSEVEVGARTVDVHITRLRKALLKMSKTGEDVIKTIRLAGYTLRKVAK